MLPMLHWNDMRTACNSSVSSVKQPLLTGHAAQTLLLAHWNIGTFQFS